MAASPALAEKASFVVRPPVYKRLSKAQEALKNNEFSKATKEIQTLMKRMKPNDHEKALAFQTLGYVFSSQEKFNKSANALNAAWELNALPEATQNSLLYNIGQLYLASEKYKLAVKKFDAWLKVTESPNGDAYYTVAAAKYQAKDLDGAITYSKKAVASTKNPKDSWLQLLLSTYIQRKRYKPAVGILAIVLERHPEKRSNWLQMVALYSELNNDKRALAVLELAKKMGVLEKKDDFIQLAQRYQSAEIPLYAAQILENALKEKKLKIDKAVAEIIGNSYYAAREDKQAVPALGRAARLGKNPDLYLRLAQIHLEKEKWSEVVKAAKNALNISDIKDRTEGKAHVLVGIAEARRGRNTAARSAFLKAAKIPSSKKVAQNWLTFIQNTEAAGQSMAIN